MFRIAFASLALLALCPSPSLAQLVDVTPEVFSKARSLAESARAKYPTSPTQAWEEFSKQFAKTLGDPSPEEATLWWSDAMSILLMTPLGQAKSQFGMALQKMTDLPTAFGGSHDALIAVTPKTITAPNFRKVGVFSGSTPVEVVSEMTDREFKTRMGATVTLATGTVKVPPSAFIPKAELKVLLFPAVGAPREITLSVKQLRKLH